MRDHRLHARSFESLCACLILAPCAALAQQSGTAPKAAASPDSAAQSTPAPADADASSPAHSTKPSTAQGDAASAAPRGAPAKRDDLEPAVDTSDDAARARAGSGHNAKPEQRGRASGKAIDHLELGTTDITGNRELPKVMYIVPWKRSDLGDLTGKPLNSLIDQTLQPVDRNVFERSNRYYGAVTAGAASGGTPSAGAGAPNAAAPNGGASQDVHRTPGAAPGSAVRDEK